MNSMCCLSLFKFKNVPFNKENILYKYKNVDSIMKKTHN